MSTFSSLRGAIGAFALALLLAGCGGDGGSDTSAAQTPAPTPTPAPTLSLEGAIDHPVAYSVADLSALPAVTQNVTYLSGNGSQSLTYTGVNLWSLLNDAGIQLDSAKHNDVLSHYVIATGSDGYQSVFSLGEINPSFGNRPNIIAYAVVNADGSSSPLSDSDGPFRVTAPADIRGGRYVSNLVSLQVMASHADTGSGVGGVSNSFTVSGQVATPATFTVDSLKSLGLTETNATVGSSVYTGVSLWDLLNRVGLKLADTHNPSLAMYAVATGSDGYQALVSLGEINPDFGNDGAIIAYAVNGEALDTNGATRLVIPGEVMQGRLVSNLTAIEVFSVNAP
jgi:DMSO/TMAO reductase YedYZ molybdopterin-dependent catalytic subunit